MAATLTFPSSIWSSQAYIPFCQAVADKLKLPPVAAGKVIQGTPLSSLLPFSEQAIQAENTRLSQWLTAEPDNASAHQQAALVLGTLAMKENSGAFWDPREACNHAVAHLAVARLLQPGADLSIEGQLAECLVGLIDDTKKECADEIDRLDKITAPPPELAAWIRIAKLRNSRDWRILDKPETASGFEQVEYFRAFSEAVSPDQAVAWLQAKSLPNQPDWTRIVLEMPFSVEEGHVFALPSISSEVRSMHALFPDRVKRETLISSLNETPEDALIDDASTRRLQVISNGLWAQFFQRHICQAIVETGNFLQNKWGVPDQAAKFDQAVDREFSTLNFYPYVQQANAGVRKMPDDPKIIAAAFIQHPEWAQDSIANLAPLDNKELPGFSQAVRSWFSPPILSGTAYVAAMRLQNIAPDLKSQPDAIHRLYLIAPLQINIAELELTARYSSQPTTAQVQEIMGPLLDYFQDALMMAINAKDVTLEQKIVLEQKAGTLDPEQYWNLAQDYLHSGRESDAADAYQHWYEKVTDRVEVSNSMDWLVNYYFDHDQKDKALAIAKDCAEVYSAGGLQTMMNLQVRMGQLDQAEDYGQKIKERYDDPGPLMTFYKHQADKGDAAFKAKFDDAILSVFPYGLKPVTLASFSGPPETGMRFTATSARLEKNGLSTAQVIVAVDGTQVQNMAQYKLARGFSDSPIMVLIVWDGQAYRELKTNQPGRRFGVDMVDYTKP